MSRTAALWRPQISLRGLLLGVAAVGACLAYYSRRAREQKEAVEYVRAAGAQVFYSFQETASKPGVFDSDACAALPSWLLESLGVDFFYNATYVDFGLRSSKLLDVPPDRRQREVEALRRVCGLAGVRFLVLSNAQATDDSLQHLSRLRSLEEVALYDASRVTDAGVRHLAPLKNLRRVTLGKSLVTDESLRILGRMPLRRLELYGGFLSDAGLSHLKTCTDLESLTLGGDAVRFIGSGLTSLSGLTELQYLDLSDCGLTGEAFEGLRQFRKLRVLDVANNPQLGDEGARALAELRCLEDLSLRNTGVTSHGAAHLRKLTRLRSLDLALNPRISDSALNSLSGMRALESLNLHQTSISSTGLRAIQGLRTLRALDLSENQGIDVSAASHVARISGLSELDVHNTYITSKGAATEEAMLHLRKLTSLSVLNVAGTGSELRVLKAALPRCWVIGSNTDGPALSHYAKDAEKYQAVLSDLYAGGVDASMAGEGGYESMSSTPGASDAMLHRMHALLSSGYPDDASSYLRGVAHALLMRLEARPDLPGDGGALSAKVHEDPILNRLYRASTNLHWADILADHLANLEAVKSEWAWTDREASEYREASHYLGVCLSEAGHQLGVSPRGGSTTADARVLDIWKATR